jgi:hypothetical protein
MHRDLQSALTTVALAVSLGAGAAHAQRIPERTFPLEITDFERPGRAGGGRLELALPAERGNLGGLSQVKFTNVPLPDGSTVALSMQRLDPARLEFGFQVDGVPAPALLEAMELEVFLGTVDGAPGSSAALAFSPHGSRGWIHRGAELYHLLAAAGPGGDWSKSTSQMMSDETLLALGNRPQPPCEIDSLPPALNPPFEQPAWTTQALSPELYRCPVSVETDDQLYAVFNDIVAESAYVTTLLTWISFRFEEQVQLVLTYPYVQFYTQGNDPWVTQDIGGTSTALLQEFRLAWNVSGIPAGGKLGTFLSGAALGGGVAYKPGVCWLNLQYSVSSGIAGTVQFPVVQQSGNWDFFVAAHELGHNFIAPHTHDWCPPLDECANSQYFGPCQSQQVCSTQGTLMSYCHQCPGFAANITTYFHPLQAQTMRAYIENNCLLYYARNAEVYCTAKTNSQGCLPTIDASGHATLSGLDDFRVTASNVVNQRDGLLFFGLAKTARPFQGGMKCVRAPLRRTAVQSSGGSVGPTDCSGSYDVFLSHSFLQSRGLVAGTNVYAQFWTSDRGSPSGTGLTDALKFLVVN